MAMRFLFGFFLGFLIGATLALALAPQPGIETRARVIERMRERAHKDAGAVDEAMEGFD
jgi:gas vesicle protein